MADAFYECEKKTSLVPHYRNVMVKTALTNITKWVNSGNEFKIQICFKYLILSQVEDESSKGAETIGEILILLITKLAPIT